MFEQWTCLAEPELIDFMQGIPEQLSGLGAGGGAEWGQELWPSNKCYLGGKKIQSFAEPAEFMEEKKMEQQGISNCCRKRGS